MQVIVKNDWGMAVSFTLLITMILFSAELLLKRLNVHPNSTRRIVHILVGILVALAPFLFEEVYAVIAIAVFFTVVNFLAIRGAKLEGIHAAKRKSYGTVYFPISFAILSYWFWDSDPAILITSMYIMTFADPVASWVGESSGSRIEFRLWYDIKSLQGSAAMFMVAFITTLTSMMIYGEVFGGAASFPKTALASFYVAVFAAVAESMSREGSDNLSVPLVSAFILNILFNGDAAAADRLMLWVFITALIAWIVYKLDSLSLSGAVAAWLLGSIVFGVGGIVWALPLIFFFVSSSIFSKIGKRHKKILREIFEKGGRRDLFQVFANGGAAMLAAVIFHFTQHELWFFVYLASLAGATADTWATELGTFSRRPPRSILSFSPVSPGSSGGVSIAGLTGALSGSFLLAAVGLGFFSQQAGELENGMILLVLITFTGFTASLFDSIAGASIQAQYKCPECGKITEKKVHCGGQNCQHIKGYRAINNDIVNSICTFSAFIIFLLLNTLY